MSYIASYQYLPAMMVVVTSLGANGEGEKSRVSDPVSIGRKVCYLLQYIKARKELLLYLYEVYSS